MDTLAVLFWTLVALLAVLMFAVEAGAASRHRTVVMCTVASTLFSVLYIMFFIDDRTRFNFQPTEDAPQKRAGRDGAGKDRDVDDAKSDAPSSRVEDTPPPSTDDRDLGRTFQDCPECPTMVRVPAGRFVMGSPADEAGRSSYEGPQRDIAISPEFAVSKSPITRDQFAMFVSISKHVPADGCVVDGRFSPKHSWLAPGFEQGGTHPVVCVSRADTVAYIRWLETRANKPYRMVSEGEWEYAARAGTTGPYWYGEALKLTAFNAGRTRDGTVPTTYTPINSFGLHDVHGNVAQWMEDCWSTTLASLPVDGNPYATAVQAACRRGVVRGGSWAARPSEARSASRAVVGDATLAYNTIGIRVAREVAAASSK